MCHHVSDGEVEQEDDQEKVTALLRAAIVGLGISACWCAHAAGYPDRPIRLIVPVEAGGATDVVYNAGSGSSQNMPPALVLNYIIKT